MSDATTLATPTARSFTANRLFPMLRAGLRTAETIGPAPAAARVAARVFCTPVPTKLATRHLRPPAGVSVETMPFENASLTLYRWPAAKDAPLVLLTHGWGGWGLQMAAIAEGLAARGMAPVAIDQPAHGRSAAWHSTLAQFARALGYLGDRLGPLRGLVGHSMGGSSAAVAAARGLATERLVTIASPTDLVQVTRDYAGAFGLRESTRQAMVRHLEAREAVVFEQLSAANTAPRLALPTLVVHDRSDTAVPVVESLKLQALLPQADLMLTDGLGHRRVLKDAAVVERVAAFLA